VCPQNCFVLY